VESFITKVSSNDISPENVIELVYQLYEISKSESIPLDQIPHYIKEKLQEKQKIDEATKEAYAILQNKNMSIEAINEHIQLAAETYGFPRSTAAVYVLNKLRDYNKKG
jgi:hypothetical protein